MRRHVKPGKWSAEERIRLIEGLLYRISAERLNMQRRARLIRYALDVAGGAPDLLDRRWSEIVCLLDVEESKGMNW